MKLKSLIFAGMAAAAALTSCSGGNNGKAIEEMQNMSTLDSMSYYYGLLNGGTFWQQSQMDTTLATESARVAFKKGLQDAFNSTDDAYNAGLAAGLQIARSLGQFKKIYGEELNPKVVITGMQYALRNDSAVNMQKTQMVFQELNMRYEAQISQKEAQEGKKALEAYAKKNGMTADSLSYVKIIKPGEGDVIPEGTRVNGNLEVSTESGVSAGTPARSSFVIGRTFSANSPVSRFMKGLKVGEQATVALTAADMYGPSVRRMNLKGSDVVIVKIKVDKVAEEEKKD